MRRMLPALSLLLALGMAGPASAETRMFIVANDAGGYGVDRCLASGDSCGQSVATAYCHARDFAQALSFRKVRPDDVTGSIPAAATMVCAGSGCGEYIAIECSR